MSAQPPALRASDADREQTALALREHCAAGRLTLEELAGRVERAYLAQTRSELDELVSDLPAERVSRLSPRRLAFAFFGSLERRGRWRARRHTAAVSVFANIDLDLRQAEIAEPVLTVWVFALFGNVDVYVPEGIEVDPSGLVVFGHRRDWGRDAPAPGAPLVRVRTIGLFGTIDVWRVPPGTKGTYREIVRELQRGERELPR